MKKISCVQGTLNLSPFVNSCTNTKTGRNGQTGKRRKILFQMSCVRCSLSHVMCHMSRVTCHLSLVTYPNSHSQRPFPWKLPNYAQQADSRRPKNPKQGQNAKNHGNGHKNLERYANISDRLFYRSLQSRGEQGFQERTDIVTDIPTYRPNRSRDRFSENANIQIKGLCQRNQK